MTKVLVLISILSLYSVQAFSAEKAIECSANQKNYSDGKVLNPIRAEFSFVETSKDGLRVIEDIEGWLKYPVAYEENGAYTGEFKIRSLKANPKYRPNRYQGASQFKDFNATSTPKSWEDGMWGSFVLEPSNKKTFQAHYIFQAGDHMGGTVHFICKKR